VIVARTVDEARTALRGLPRPLGLVPTMGALHRGHLSLLEAARSRCASVAASLFVNPTQFAAGEDFHKYPRDEARDLRLFEEAGVSAVFAPAAAEMYAADYATIVHVGGPLTESFEAAERPSHFDGVASIVTKLLNVTQPDAAFFGQKDAQQLAVIRRVARDLDLAAEIVGVPTVREPDGLALSSRNAYLTPAQRAVAPGLYLALLAGARAAGEPGAGPRDAIATAAMALAMPDAGLRDEEDRRRELLGQSPDGPPRFAVDYVAVVDADTFVQEHEVGPRSLFIGAARLGLTRLIDNVPLGVTVTPDRPATTSHASAYPAKDATD
jgi:pantoate--beta-alanine ligase